MQLVHAGRLHEKAIKQIENVPMDGRMRFAPGAKIVQRGEPAAWSVSGSKKATRPTARP